LGEESEERELEVLKESNVGGLCPPCIISLALLHCQVVVCVGNKKFVFRLFNCTAEVIMAFIEA
jgi:hypothetical protein